MTWYVFIYVTVCSFNIVALTDKFKKLCHTLNPWLNIIPHTNS